MRALAAVAAATGAMAQSTVTISGNLNINAINNTKVTTQTGTNAATFVKTSNTGLREGWTASQIGFSGTEDLGGGLKASFVINSRLDNNPAAGRAILGGRDTNVALEGGFGTVRLGRFIPAAASGFHGYTGARTTNQAGSLYTGLLGGGEAAFGNADDVGGSFERQDAVVQYTSPSFNGITVNVSYGNAGSDNSAQVGDSDSKQTGLSVTYTAGPLSIAAGMNNRDVNVENPTAANRTARDANLDWFGASYDLGVAKVSIAQIKRDAKTSTGGAASVTNTDIKANAIGVTVPMGAFTFAASTYSGKNKVGAAATDDLKLSGHQLSVTYALSKRTTIYAAMGENKTKRDGANTAGDAVKSTSNAIGLMHTF